jgi:hypothetical protein
MQRLLMVLLVISLSGSAIAEKLSNYFFKTYTSYCYHRTRNSSFTRVSRSVIAM